MGNEQSGQQTQARGRGQVPAPRRVPGSSNSTTPARRPATSGTGPVRCPSCRRMLQPPPGSPRFRCPCSQVLMAPTPQPVHVKCPRCHLTLAPPPGAEIFRCPCGTALRPPVQRQTSSRALAVPNNPTQTFKQGAGKKVSENLLPDEIAAQVRKPNEEYWLRNTVGDNLCWVRLLSEEQEAKINKLLADCPTDMKGRIDTMSLEDLQFRLEMLGLAAGVEGADEAVLKEKLLNSKDTIMSTLDQKAIMKRLDGLNVEHNTCQDLEDFAERLVAAAWYGPNRFSDGFVRKFTGDFDMEMVPAQQFALPIDGSEHGVSPVELERVTQMKFSDKVKWFRGMCKKRKVKWEDGRVQIKIRRDELLRDSFNNFNRLKPYDLRRYLRFEFIGEEGVDAGGVAREWFELVTDACFNVDCGLFEYSGVDDICYEINPASGIANDLHEQYFLFLGRVIGKALFDQHHIRAHVTQSIYKHILGWPITMKDIEYTDYKLYETLVDMEKADNVEDYLLTFTTTMEIFGEHQEIELKPGGDEIEVTQNNLQEYIQSMTKYYMFERTKEQLAHFLRGIYDVIPEVWLSVFDFRELELLMCGLPAINVDDWKSNTRYRGQYAAKGEKHKVVRWFWEVVTASSQEQRALILQYCTGTSRVPVNGFKALQGNDGNIKIFTIDSAKLSDVLYPKAHTCFNRIELPMYKSKSDLIKCFEEALTQGATGFNDE